MNLINIDKNGNNAPIKVFKSENGKYSIQISTKKGEEYVNKYFPVEFLKDVNVENGTMIIIKHAFLTFFDWTYGEQTGTKWLAKITAFDYADAPQTQSSVDVWASAKETTIDESDLPFFN